MAETLNADIRNYKSQGKFSFCCYYKSLGIGISVSSVIFYAPVSVSALVYGLQGWVGYLPESLVRGT